LAKGSGPRHFTFHPNGRLAFVICDSIRRSCQFASMRIAGPFRRSGRSRRPLAGTRPTITAQTFKSIRAESSCAAPIAARTPSRRSRSIRATATCRRCSKYRAVARRRDILPLIQPATFFLSPIKTATRFPCFTRRRASRRNLPLTTFTSARRCASNSFRKPVAHNPSVDRPMALSRGVCGSEIPLTLPLKELSLPRQEASRYRVSRKSLLATATEVGDNGADG
jgi:hypothetical protein